MIRNTLVLITILAACEVSFSHIDGDWVMPCRDGLAKTQANKNETSVTTESFHKDKDCSSKSFEFKVSGFITMNEAESNWIDFQYDDVHLTVFVQAVIDDFNHRRACGISNWEVGRQQRITGLPCAIFNYHKETQIPRAGDLRYGIYNVIEDKLFYGALSVDRDGSTPAKRPQELLSEPFIRKP